MYLSALMVPSQICKLLMQLALTLPKPSQMLAFELCADNNLNSPFLFGPEDITFMISKNNLKCGLFRPQHTFFPLCISPSEMSSGPEKPIAFLGVDLWLCFAW
ncbi:hypothetical protein ILYODFUR_013953 [Ilyodon furcidens]|uniref:Uncharacterized protein n=1 Tax=Ilyodon furcidens TaxID=33524 RepID=A0ABV0UTK8_9TELE